MNDETAQTDGLDRAPGTVAKAGDGEHRGLPSVAIILDVEARPRVVWDCLTEAEHRHLRSWLRHSGLWKLVALAVLRRDDWYEHVDWDAAIRELEEAGDD